MTDFSNGTTQQVTWNPSPGIAQQIVNYDAQDNVTSELTNSTNGTSTLIKYDIPQVDSQTTTYSQLNGQGTPTSQVTDFSNGTTQQITWNPAPGVAQQIVNYDAKDNVTSQTTNATNGTSTVVRYDIAGVDSQTTTYTQPNGQGTQTSQVTDFSNGTTQQITWNPAAGIAQKIVNYDASDNITSETLNLTGGTSTIILYTIPGTDSVTINYSLQNGGGTKTSQIIDLSDGTTQETIWNPDPSNPNIAKQITWYDANDNVTQETTTFAGGNSQVAVYNPAANIQSVVTQYSGPDGTGTPTSKTTIFDDHTEITEYNPDGSIKSVQGVYGASESLTASETPDGNGGWTTTVEISDQYKQANPSALRLPSEIDGGQIGEIFGSQIGQALAGNNVFAKIAEGSVLGAVLSDVGKSIQADLTQNIDIGSALQSGFGQFGTDLLKEVDLAGAGSVSSFLIAELDQDLGLGHSFGAQLFNAVTAGVTTKLLSNAAQIAEGLLPSANLFTGLGTGVLTSVGGFFGSYLAHEILAPQTTAGAVGSAIGSGLGSYIGGTYAASAATVISGALADIGVDVVGSLGADAAALIFDGIADIILPGIGALIGALLGTALGDWLSTLINGTPQAWTAVTLDPVTGHFVVGLTESKGDGSTAFGISEATAAVTTLNAYIDAIGGTSVQNAPAWQSYGYKGSTILYSRSVGETSAQALLDYGVITTIKQLKITGGDMILKRAIANSTATTVAGLNADIGVAQQYEVYQQNKAIINLLIELDPQSAFAAGWIVTLARAHELGLDTWSKTDFYGGISCYLQSLNLDKAGVKPEDVNFTIDGANLNLDICVNGKFIPTITIQNYAQYFNLQQFAAGMPDDTRLYGEGGNVFNSDGVASYEHGKGGGDTFLYNAGYGALEIDETDSSANPNNILKLGAGIGEAQLQVTYDTVGNLFIADGVTGDRIKIDGGYANAARGIDGIQFADGTVWTRAQLLAQAVAAAPDSTGLYATATGSTLDTKGAVSYVHGLGGGDTFVYNAGYGALEIDETDTSSTPDNTLLFGSDITPAQVKVTSDEAGNLFLSDGVTGDRIKIDGGALNSGQGVQNVQFADGTTWSVQELLNQTTIGNPGNTALYGSGGNVFDSKGIATYEHGVGGGDTFLYNPGYGQLEIDETGTSATPNNVLKLGAGILADQVIVLGDSAGNIFLFDKESGDEIKLDGELSSPSRGVQSVVFADGTTWTRQDLLNAQGIAAWQQPSNTLAGTESTDSKTGQPTYTFDSQGVASYIQGKSGEDVIVYNADYGKLQIDETGWNFGSNSIQQNAGVLQFGAGITSSQIMVTSDSAGNLYLNDGTPGDLIRVDAGSNLSVSFADGTSWTYSQLAALAVSPVTGLYATGYGQTLDAGGKENYVHGLGGGDTFVFNQGYGYLEIDETDTNAQRDNVLSLGSGITAKNLEVTSDAAGNIFLTVTGTSLTHDEIKLDGELSDPSRGVQAVQFADGTTWTRAQLIAESTSAHPDNRLYGTKPGETYDGQGYSSYAYGLGGGDTFVYGAGYGAFEIQEADSSASPNNALKLTGITPSQVQVYGDEAGNLFITDPAQLTGSGGSGGGSSGLPGVAAGTSSSVNTSGDLLKIDNQLLGQPYGIESVRFDDGTVWTAAQLDLMATTGSATNTKLYGGYGDTYDSKGYASYAHSLGGGSTFIYNPGYGKFEIDESDATTATPDNVLKLGAGIAESEAQVTGDSSGNITIAFNGDQATVDGVQFAHGSDQVILDNQLYSPADGVQQIQFADGTVWTQQQIDDLATTGSTFNTTLYGAASGDTFDPKGYAHAAYGRGGGDTFIYNIGYGALEINEPDDYANNVLKLGTGISPSQVTVTGNQNGDLILTDGTSGDKITLDGELLDLVHGVESVQFADGTVWSRQQLEDQATIGSSSNTSLYGGYGGNIYDSKGIATLAYGRGGGDTFIYNAGYGNLEINETDPTAAPDNVLQLGSGIAAAQIKVTADLSGNLYITDGTTGDKIKIDAQIPGLASQGSQTGAPGGGGSGGSAGGGGSSGTPGTNGSSTKSTAPTGIKGIQTVQFADGTVWTAQQLDAAATYIVQPGDNQSIPNFIAGPGGTKLDFSAVGPNAVITPVSAGTQIVAGTATVLLPGMTISSLSLHDNFIGLTAVSFPVGGITANMASGSAGNDGLVHISTVTLSGTGNTIDATSGDTVAFGANSSGTVNGTGVTVNGANGDTITLSAGASDSIGGSGATIVADSTSTLSFAAGVTGTVSGSGVTINAASGDVLVASNGTVNIAASAAVTIAGISNVIDVTSGDTVNLNGGANTANVSGSGVTVNVNGSSNTVTVTGNNDTINFAAGIAGTVNGSGTTINAANGDVLTASNDTVNLATDATATVTGSGNTINAATGSTLTASGDTITIVGAAGGSYGSLGRLVTVSGTGNTINAASGDTVTFGTNSTATVNGSGITIAVASGDTVTLAASASDSISGSGATIVAGSTNTLGFAASATDTVNGTGVTINAGTGDALTASGDAVNLAANVTAAVTGSGNTISASTGSSVTASGDTINIVGAGGESYGSLGRLVTVSGSGNTINAASGDMITFGASSTATVNGSGITIAVASGDTITLAASASDGISGSGATIVAGSTNTLSFAVNATDTVNGTGVTIAGA
ncbi:MAG: beta strand repeat-containing protein, partial [Candidatus Korobacteraceae bacterium]